MKLKTLLKEYIDTANRPMDFGALPIQASEAEAPLIATDRWKQVENALVKKFQFRREGDRDKFLLGVLDYERQVKHNALIVIEADKVLLKLHTHDVDRITELDKEYARFADVLFKDVVYSPDYHGAETQRIPYPNE